MQHFNLTEKLHTDVLEEKYGPISSKVIKHNSQRREALLVDEKGIARTYALTFISQDLPSDVAEINEQIKQGQPIGKAFREAGYSIRKNVLDVFIIRIPKWLKKEFATKESNAKARLSEFYAKKEGSKPVIYGVVTEVYSPDFRKPKINPVDKSQITVLSKCLEKKGFSKEEIWRRIGDDNNYEDVQQRFQQAKKISKEFIAILLKEIKRDIQTP